MPLPTFSLIIPVYRAAARLPRCLDSVLAQTRPDWECLLVDDGSPDASPALCDAYARRDARFRVWHKANAGAAAARNAALAEARGEWVTFVDADDYLSPRFLEAAATVHADVVLGQSRKCHADGSTSPYVTLHAGLHTTPESYRLFVQTHLHTSLLRVPWGKLIRRERLVHITFPVGQPVGEDTLFMCRLLAQCHSIGVSPESVYYWQENEVSLTLKYHLPPQAAATYMQHIMQAYEGLHVHSPAFERLIFDFFFALSRMHSLAALRTWLGHEAVRHWQRRIYGRLPFSWLHPEAHTHAHVALCLLRLQHLKMRLAAALRRGH